MVEKTLNIWEKSDRVCAKGINSLNFCRQHLSCSKNTLGGLKTNVNLTSLSYLFAKKSKLCSLS